MCFFRLVATGRATLLLALMSLSSAFQLGPLPLRTSDATYSLYLVSAREDPSEWSSRTTVTRRKALVGGLALPFLSWIQIDASFAETGAALRGSRPSKVGKIKPEDAMQGLVLARKELQTAASSYLKSQDYDGMRDFLKNEAVNMQNYEPNVLSILASKRLEEEDKKAIGTIRTYGVGADVMIMYGGLMAEIDEMNTPDVNTVAKYLTRTVESLDEVITICRNNGL